MLYNIVESWNHIHHLTSIGLSRLGSTLWIEIIKYLELIAIAIEIIIMGFTYNAPIP